MGFTLLEKKELKSTCSCSWERVRRALTLVGPNELESMLEETGEATVKCDFCETEYKADRAELMKIIEESKS